MLSWKHYIAVGIGTLIASTSVHAQDTQRPIKPSTEPNLIVAPIPGTPKGYSVIDPEPNPLFNTLQAPPPVTSPAGQEPASRPGERASELGATEQAKWGPTSPDSIGTFKDLFYSDSGIRFYGWLDTGYTYASTGSGRLATEPRPNRFGNEFVVNQIATVLEKPLKQSDQFDWGFNMTFYSGADPALIQPRGEFNTTDPRFGADFRQLYVSAHLPILTEGGLDVKVGRMGSVIGYTSAMAPYRPFYSNNYQWFYAQDGAFTGAVTTLHVNKQLDIVNGITMGANTFFTYRGTGPCYIGQINYWLTEEKKTLLSGAVYLGNNAIFAAPGMAGTFDTTLELRLQHHWSSRFTTILQSDMGWDANVPNVGTASWYSLYAIGQYHLTETVDVNGQVEWFNDVQGTRTGTKNRYEMVTFGINYHPNKYIELRPEIRGDFANDRPAFGPSANNKNQLTMAIDLLLKF